MIGLIPDRPFKVRYRFEIVNGLNPQIDDE